MAPRNRNSGWSRGVAAVLAAVLTLGGVAISLGFGVRLRAALERTAQNRVVTATAAVQDAVNDQLARYLDTVRLTAAGLTAVREPTAATFEQVTAAVVARKLPAGRAVRLVVPAAPEDLGAVESRWRSRGVPDLAFKPFDGTREHLFTVFARGLGGGKAPPAGVDQSASTAEVEVVRQARTSNGVAVSDAYVLLTDTGLATDEQQLSFDVVAPVLDARNRPAAFVMLSIGGAEFVSAALTRSAGDLLDVQLMTRSGSGTLTEVATVLHAGRHEDVRRAVDFEVGQRQWVLRATADNRVLLPNAGRTDLVVVIAGSVLAIMFGGLMYLQMSATKRFERELELELAERLGPADADEEEEEADVAETEPTSPTR